MTTFTLSLVDAKHLAAALIPHISTDDVTPVLTGALVEGQYAYATDRYTVGRYDLTNIFVGTDGAERIWIPRAALAWIKTLGKTFLFVDDPFAYRVRFTHIPHERYESEDQFRVEVMWRGNDPDKPINETHVLRTFHPTGARGNFPPVERLFDSFLPGEQGVVGVGPVQVEKFTSYARFVDRNAPMKVTVPAPSDRAKLSPYLVEIGTRFKGLLQPNLILNDSAFGVNLAAKNKAEHEAEERKRADAKPAETTEASE